MVGNITRLLLKRRIGMIKVTVYNEFVHEKEQENVKKVYPNGMHAAIKEFLEADGRFEVKTATLDMPEHGLTKEVLDDTDVLIWWGHCAHHLVSDEVVERVYNKVLSGMGMVVLHSGHFSKIFKKLNGTGCNLKWRESGDKERIWITAPSHPIAAGLPEHFELEHEETYGEHFDIAKPDEVVFTSWFSGGEVFRSGCTFTRGNGRIFYFRPGHESFPTFYDENVQKVIKNATAWAAQPKGIFQTYGHYPSLEADGGNE